MEKSFVTGYILLSILLAAIDGLVAYKSFKKGKKTGFYLGWCCIMSAVVDISYLGSILETNYFRMSLMSSIYFVSIDIALVLLLMFILYFTRMKLSRLERLVCQAVHWYVVFDAVVFAINPFYELVISYGRQDTLIAHYTFIWHPLYVLHLAFAYAMTAGILILMIYKGLRAPAEYRNPYIFMGLGIVGIVLVNAVFLLLPEKGIYNLLDYSICGYSITVLIMYWSCFNYASRGLLNRLKTRVFEGLDQGLVLFDYEEKLILTNRRAQMLLGGEELNEDLDLKTFMSRYHIYMEESDRQENNVMQFFVSKGDELLPLMCDIRILRGRRDQILGHLMTLTDMTLETDVLTGFQSWKSFKRFLQDKEERFSLPLAIGICDINGLAVLNSTQGSDVGDQKIKDLANVMRQHCPKQSYFVRGSEAYLIVLSSSVSEQSLRAALEEVKANFHGSIQYSMDEANEAHPDILEAIRRAAKSMQAKKLLDQDSSHSELLTSLMRALQECDSDTEKHVYRTQLTGNQLGRRIGLTDYQLSQLSLLCLLHDIGKIGIPLDILNKPGKLSEEEWRIMQSHVVKGYEIARSNKAFQFIADEILHHHERWDGKGYPDGLSQESIPILSRVISVVDAYDAMINDRVYRSALSQTEALAELKRCAGTQFDPFLVAEFLKIIKVYEDDAADKSEVLSGKQFSIARDEGEGKKTDYSKVHVLEFSRYCLSTDLKIIEVDNNFEKMTGYSRKDVEELQLSQIDLIPADERTEYLRVLNVQRAQDQKVYLEHRLQMKDHTELRVLGYGRWFYFVPAREERIEVLISNVSDTYYMRKLAETENEKARQRLKYWEKTYRNDSLTGLLNHAAFRNDVELRLLEGKTKVLMMMLDLDKFKNYNDTYGHRAGDEYLILTAHTLLSALREEDQACRMGGDEFAAALFFDSKVPNDKIVERAQQIFDKLTLILSATPGGAGISAGGVIAQESGISFNDLYERADQALYTSKEGGRGRLTIQ